METTEVQKTNYLLDFFKAWLYIFLFALRGLKFILMDIWVVIFNYFSFNLNKTYQQIKNIDSEEQLEDDIYLKTKNKPKKIKQYHYSARQMAKYEKMKQELNSDLQMAGAVRSKTPNIYQFTVKDPKNGKIFKDTMPGYSKLDINSFLVNEGYEVYDIKNSKLINFIYQDSSLLGSKMSIKDLVFWLTQLSTYIKAGITLSESVKILSAQMKTNRKTQRIFQSICYELSLGESFSSALAKQGNFFPPLLINMIKAAEASGTLQETLDDMSNYYTEVNETRKEMISALTYPTIITIFAVAVVTFIIIYVVPQFTKIYQQSDVEIKGLTKVIVNLSNFLSNNLILVILIIVFIMVIVFFLYKKIKAFRVPCQILFMKLPVIKNIIIYKEFTIFAKTFASLLRNNVYITDSMDILMKITNNEIYRSIMQRTIKNIIKGEKISDAFKDHWAVPDVAYYMIVTGESTGQLDDMMQKVSDYYQLMHKQLVNSLKSIIEPVMIVFLAVMVGMIILAVIVPMFSLYNEIL